MTCVIPARGGSKRIPQKNIRDFCGRPVISYPIAAAQESGLFDEVYVSTDDATIATVATAHGAKVLQRSHESSTDRSPMVDVILEHAGRASGDLGCMLYACNPFVTADLIARGHDLISQSLWIDSAFTAYRSPSDVERALTVSADGSAESRFPENDEQNNLGWESSYFHAEMFFWFRWTSIQKSRTFMPAGRCGAITVSRHDCETIDTPEDWEVAEYKYGRSAASVINIKSFDDVELHLMRGQGLAASSYRAYMSSVRGLYDFTDGLSPLQIIPQHIESYFDELLKRGLRRVSAHNQATGLKRFFAGVAKMVPGYVSPFEVMDPALVKKLNKRPATATKKALTKIEVRKLLAWLRGSPMYTVIYMLVTSGLRAAELCQLRWRDLEYDAEDGSWLATFVQKGGDEVHAELYGPAVDALGKHGRGDEYLFTRPNGRPFDPHSLWYQLKKLEAASREAGIITRPGIQFSPHLMRRTFVTLLYKSGMKLKALQGKSRNKSIEMLARHYVDDAESAAPYLDQVFAS